MPRFVEASNSSLPTSRLWDRWECTVARTSGSATHCRSSSGPGISIDEYQLWLYYTGVPGSTRFAPIRDSGRF
jgi:hypothetical protein